MLHSSPQPICSDLPLSSQVAQLPHLSVFWAPRRPMHILNGKQCSLISDLRPKNETAGNAISSGSLGNFGRSFNQRPPRMVEFYFHLPSGIIKRHYSHYWILPSGRNWPSPFLLLFVNFEILLSFI